MNAAPTRMFARRRRERKVEVCGSGKSLLGFSTFGRDDPLFTSCARLIDLSCEKVREKIQNMYASKPQNNLHHTCNDDERE